MHRGNRSRYSLALQGVLAVLVLMLPPALAAGAANEASAVATFNCIGLYWNCDEGSATRTCLVRYRPRGSERWREALPLWFDERGPEAFEHLFRSDDKSDTSPTVTRLRRHSRQYRGSIVGLQGGTGYEIELKLAGGAREARLEAETWSERPVISEKVVMPAASEKTFVVEKSGSADGYVLYTHGSGVDTATIDVADKFDHCMEVRASHVIIRDMTLKGARIHGIRIFEGSHDVIIEGCDISGWGRPDELEGEKWGRNMDSAIYARQGDPRGAAISRIVIQRCRIHHPRYDTNAWGEYRKTMDPKKVGKSWHPMGPQGISLFNTAGNHVVRYNDIWSDGSHYYNDILGGGSNFSAAGSPNRDSDIYGNRLRHCWDDGIEAEGANCNVRIWGNYISDTMVAIATASTHVGPLYIWRNVYGASRRGPAEPSGGPFLKAGLNSGFGGGRTYVFHNTLLQPRTNEQKALWQGASLGLSEWGGGLLNHVSRNNIWQVLSERNYSIQERGKIARDNDYDHDMFNGRVVTLKPQEEHGVKAAPRYDSGNKADQFFLGADSPGRDGGVALPNFNDDYLGSGPDVGAFEAGAAPLEFGVEACRSDTKSGG